MQLPFWFCSSDPAGMALRESQGQVPPPLQGSSWASLKPVKRGEGRVILTSSQCSTLTALTESVNISPAGAEKALTAGKRKRKWVKTVSLEDSQPANTSCLFLFSISASSLKSEFYHLTLSIPFLTAVAAHKIKSYWTSAEAWGWHLIWGILEYFSKFIYKMGVFYIHLLSMLICFCFHLRKSSKSCLISCQFSPHKVRAESPM